MAARYYLNGLFPYKNESPPIHQTRHMQLIIIRTFFHWSSHIAPNLIGALAFRLFCTPSKTTSASSAYNERITSANALLASGENHSLSVNGEMVETWLISTTVQDPRGYIVLIHGWSSRAAHLAKLITPLTELGYNVVLIDLPAHGNSGGKRVHLPLAVDAMHAIHQHYGNWEGIVAHSFGGVVACSVITGAIEGRSALPCSRLALISAPESVRELFTDFSTFIRLSNSAQQYLFNKVEAVCGRNIDYYSGAGLLERCQTPTLVLHAEDDKEVAYACAERFKASGDFVTLLPINGAGHRRILNDERMLKAVSEFFE